MTEPRLVWDVQADLGEGPVWDSRGEVLWFTDIKKHAVHRIDPKNGDRRSWTAPEQVGFVFPLKGGGLIAGLQSGLYRFDSDSGAFDRIVRVEPDKPSNRLNDGTVDPLGRLWFGTMDDSERAATGAYYCFERGELRPTGLGGISITNGPAVSPDGSTFYWVDTLDGTLSACAIGAGGALGRSRQIVRIAAEDGHPDGPTVDSEGCIWVGLYGGWQARRYSPEGALMETVRFPVANITKIAFGGRDLRTAYATTARHLLKPDQIERQPWAGGLFAFEVDVPGVAIPPVAG